MLTWGTLGQKSSFIIWGKSQFLIAQPFFLFYKKGKELHGNINL